MFINQMSRSRREGKVVGTLVITTCIMLGIVWLVGHLLLATNPGGPAVAGEPGITSSDGTLVADTSVTADQNSGDDEVSGSHSFDRNEDDADTPSGSEEGEQFDPSRYGVPDTAAGLADADSTTSSADDPSSNFDTNDSTDQGSRFQNDPNQFANSSTDTQDWNTGDADAGAEANLTGDLDGNFADDLTGDMANDVTSMAAEDSTESQTNFDPGPIEETVDDATDTLGLTETTNPNFDPPIVSANENVETPLPVTDELGNSAAEATTVVSKPALPETQSEPENEMTSAPQPESPNLVDLTRRMPRTGRPLNTGDSRNLAKPKTKTLPSGTYSVRTWTSIDGKQVRARYESQDARNTILRVGEKRYRVPFSRLSKGDLEHLRIIRQAETSKP